MRYNYFIYDITSNRIALEAWHHSQAQLHVSPTRLALAFPLDWCINWQVIKSLPFQTLMEAAQQWNKLNDEGFRTVEYIGS